MTSENNIFVLPSLNFKEELGDRELIMAKKKSEDLQKYDPLIFCRTCANIDNSLVPIFKEEGLSYNLNKKIEKYLPIQVSQDDDLPVQLCYHCASTLIAWDSLIIGCVEAEKKLNLLKNSARRQEFEYSIEKNEYKSIDSDDEPLITKKDNKIDKGFGEFIKVDEQYVHKSRNNLPQNIDFQTHSDLKAVEPERSPLDDFKKPLIENIKKQSEGFGDDDGLASNGNKYTKQNNNLERSEDLKLMQKSLFNISCKYCGKISYFPKTLQQDERQRLYIKNFQCDECIIMFTKESNLMENLKRNNEDKLEQDLKKFACRICNKKFKFEDNGLAHEKICGRKESIHKCSVCRKRFESKELADQHWTCHHKSCVCHLCGQSFRKPESLKQHIKTVHEELKMVCHFCGKKFSRKARLQEHLQRHTGQMEFTCHVCGKGSTNAYSFGVHLATHSQETPYMCSFCPRTFKHMKYVYLHERSVHLKLKSGKTYVKPKKPGKNVAQRTCPLCGKMFKRESAMQIHKRSVHEGKNGYICKLCGKDFKYTYLLYVHKKKHHFPELCKYVCQFCEKPFPVKTELQNHLRKHTGEKPYVCSICGKMYSFHGSLNMHMKTQHENNKNFKCSVCGSSYNFLSHLARHMSAHGHKYSPQVHKKNL